jgi:hypothetical protein
MRHLRLFRALLGGAGLVGCVGLLAGQARADIVEFVPVRSADPAAISRAENPPSTRPQSVANAQLTTKAAPRSVNSHETDCKAHRIAMAPAKTRAPD